MQNKRRQKIAGEISPKGEGFVKGLAIDPVIFGFHQGVLKVLIVEHGETGLFALPGGYIWENENLEDAAIRVLKARTGLSDIYLKQFHIFGDLKRNNPKTIRSIMEGQGINYQADHWILGRFFSIGYLALVDFTKAIPTPDSVSDSCTWYNIDKCPPLILDHKDILQTALNTLRESLENKSSGFTKWASALMTEPFTMQELQILYETILGEKQIRTNFQRKMLSFEMLEMVDKKRTGAAHKPAHLYRFI